ncbi:MAG: AAA domain-containing protein [Microscillaceae bacterium]|nr:AAA domain-containing protein [Microscillaceae bacterium]
MPENRVEDFSALWGKAGFRPETGEFPLNLILYGPPGTGKTHRALRYALSLASGLPLPQLEVLSPAEQQALQAQHEKKGQIAIVSFHPGFAYEDFIQGLRPNIQAGTLLFEKRDGILKIMADKARLYQEQGQALAGIENIPFADLLNLFLSQHLDPDTEEIELSLHAPHRIFQSFQIFEIGSECLYFRRRTRRNILKKERKVLKIGKLEKYFLKEKTASDKEALFYQSLGQDLRAFAQKLRLPAKTASVPRFVLVIDEINRADTALVFGELLSLLDADKRLGATQALQLQLPSGDSLSLPANLYLIGTMNTADHSIQRLDTALRRRFVFEAVYPEPALVQDATLRQVMLQMNQWLLQETNEKGRLIGQALFWQKNAQDLPFIFNQQLIPLLEDYFPQQPEKLKALLKHLGLPWQEEGPNIWVVAPPSS